MSIKPLDTLIAIKVLALVPGLNASDRRVAAVLLEHFNRRTGQCDPGLERIANLLCISTRTVIRSNHKLVGAGVFRKVRHGGHGNRNSYEPVWGRFTECEALWCEKLKKGSKPSATKLSPSPSQGCHVSDDRAVTQTCRNNLPKETCPKRPTNKPRAAGDESSRAKVAFGNRSADVAATEAERRWSSDLLRKFGATPITYGQVIEAIGPALQFAATDAEMKVRGAGLAHIVKQLKLE
jgi:hypothetical protein